MPSRFLTGGFVFILLSLPTVVSKPCTPGELVVLSPERDAVRFVQEPVAVHVTTCHNETTPPAHEIIVQLLNKDTGFTLVLPAAVVLTELKVGNYELDITLVDRSNGDSAIQWLNQAFTLTPEPSYPSHPVGASRNAHANDDPFGVVLHNPEQGQRYTHGWVGYKFVVTKAPGIAIAMVGSVNELLCIDLPNDTRCPPESDGCEVVGFFPVTSLGDLQFTVEVIEVRTLHPRRARAAVMIHVDTLAVPATPAVDEVLALPTGLVACELRDEACALYCQCSHLDSEMEFTVSSHRLSVGATAISSFMDLDTQGFLQLYYFLDRLMDIVLKQANSLQNCGERVPPPTYGPFQDFVVVSFADDDPAMFYAPILCQVWNSYGFTPLVLLIGDDWELAGQGGPLSQTPLGVVINELLRGGFKTVFVPSHNCSHHFVSQLAPYFTSADNHYASPDQFLFVVPNDVLPLPALAKLLKQRDHSRLVYLQDPLPPALYKSIESLWLSSPIMAYSALDRQAFDAPYLGANATTWRSLISPREWGIGNAWTARIDRDFHFRVPPQYVWRSGSVLYTKRMLFHELSQFPGFPGNTEIRRRYYWKDRLDFRNKYYAIEPAFNPDNHLDVRLPQKGFTESGWYRTASVLIHVFSELPAALNSYRESYEHAITNTDESLLPCMGFHTDSLHEYMEGYSRCHSYQLSGARVPRLVVFYMRDGEGWAGQHMALMQAFLFALSNKRALVVDFDSFPFSGANELFRAPPFAWNLRDVLESFPHLRPFVDAAHSVGFDECGDSPDLDGIPVLRLNVCQFNFYALAAGANLWEVYNDVRPTFLTGRLSHFLLQPSASFLRTMRPWLSMFETHTVIGLGYRGGGLGMDYSGAQNYFSRPFEMDRFFNCSKELTYDGKTAFLVVSDSLQFKERAVEIFGDAAVIVGCKAVHFWNAQTREEFECIFLEWFLLSLAHDSVNTYASRYQQSAASRQMGTPIVLNLGNNVCWRVVYEHFLLPDCRIDPGYNQTECSLYSRAMASKGGQW